MVLARKKEGSLRVLWLSREGRPTYGENYFLFLVNFVIVEYIMLAVLLILETFIDLRE